MKNGTASICNVKKENLTALLTDYKRVYTLRINYSSPIINTSFDIFDLISTTKETYDCPLDNFQSNILNIFYPWYLDSFNASLKTWKPVDLKKSFNFPEGSYEIFHTWRIRNAYIIKLNVFWKLNNICNIINIFFRSLKIYSLLVSFILSNVFIIFTLLIFVHTSFRRIYR